MSTQQQIQLTKYLFVVGLYFLFLQFLVNVEHTRKKKSKGRAKGLVGLRPSADVSSYMAYNLTLLASEQGSFAKSLFPVATAPATEMCLSLLGGSMGVPPSERASRFGFFPLCFKRANVF